MKLNYGFSTKLWKKLKFYYNYGPCMADPVGLIPHRITVAVLGAYVIIAWGDVSIPREYDRRTR